LRVDDGDVPVDLLYGTR